MGGEGGSSQHHAACHARAASVEETDWLRIAALYEALAGLTPSPVVELNRAVAVSRGVSKASATLCLAMMTQSPRLDRVSQSDVLEDKLTRGQIGALTATIWYLR